MYEHITRDETEIYLSSDATGSTELFTVCDVVVRHTYRFHFPVLGAKEPLDLTPASIHIGRDIDEVTAHLAVDMKLIRNGDYLDRFPDDETLHKYLFDAHAALLVRDRTDRLTGRALDILEEGYDV